MNRALIAMLAASLLLAALAGCTKKPPAAETPPAVGAAAAVQIAYPKGSVKVGDKAVCAVCASNGGEHDAEAAAAVLDYKGKTYAFCNEPEKAEFISNPSKYAQP